MQALLLCAVCAFLVCLLLVPAASARWKPESFADHFSAHATTPKDPVREHAKLSARKDVSQLDRVQPHVLHQLVFACAQNDLQELERIVHDVSDLRSPNFGKHLTRSEVNAITANPASSERIIRFLERSGVRIVHRTINDAYITAEASMDVWEKMLDTEFYHFSVQGPTKSRTIIRSLNYAMPVFLSGHVSAVFNVIDFPPHGTQHVVRKKWSEQSQRLKTMAVSDGDAIPLCLGNVGYACPASLNYIYDMRSNTGSNVTSQAIFATIGQTMSPTDLTYFQQSFDLPVQAIADNIGGHVADDACVADDGDNCDEANLDIQYMMGMSQSIPTTFYYTNEGWLGWITEVADMEDPPKVFSISYGASEIYISQYEADSFNTEAMKLAAMGVTITASSGDDGAPDNGARDNGRNCGYYPSFPASCPYVTAVGGTQGPETGSEEIACQSQLGGVITSGGGFSTLYTTPSWQADQVGAYLNAVNGTDVEPPFGYNALGRGYPDVSMLAVEYITVNNLQYSVLYGTSASSPLFAAMIAQINAARVAAGKSNLGWLNPSLYSLTSSILLNDITSGHNKCTAQSAENICCAQGYYAQPGWDPVTGIGSVNFTAMYDAFMRLGGEPNVPTLAPTAVTSQSSRPVAAPTAPPTIEQTAMPTLSAGWVYAYYYTSTDCGGTLYGSNGQPTDVCLIDYNATQYAIGSRMYSCGSQYAHATYFNSLDCTPGTEIGLGTMYLGCSVQSFGQGELHSTSFACTTNRDAYPLYDGDFAVINAYNDDVCGGVITEFSAFKNNMCVALGVQDSYLITYPTIAIYNDSSTCATQPIGYEQFNSTCTLAGDDDSNDGDDISYYGTTALSEESILYTPPVPTAPPSVMPTQAPSQTPSQAPSARPTQIPSRAPSATPTVIATTAPTPVPSVNDLVYFAAAQVINGIDINTYNSDVATYSNSLKLSIASCMQNVATSNIINLVVTPTTSSSSASLFTALASSPAINAAYDVNVHDPTASYASLSGQLSTAVSTGVFTTYLQSYAASTGATGFAGASSTSVTTTDLESSGGGGGSGLSAGAIAGIVIGIVAFLALVGFIAFRYVSSKGTSAPAVAQEVNMAAVGNPIGKGGANAV